MASVAAVVGAAGAAFGHVRFNQVQVQRLPPPTTTTTIFPFPPPELRLCRRAVLPTSAGVQAHRHTGVQGAGVQACMLAGMHACSQATTLFPFNPTRALALADAAHL